MLKYGNKDFRNIQEQVAKNMNDIDWLINYKGALNEFGIKVVGQGPKFGDGLPDPDLFELGDVVAAGVDDADYAVYICYDEDNANAWTEDIETYKEYHEGWEYGDAWIFGDEEPYEMFILTRSNGSNPNDYFLPVGQFPIPGPQGEQGEQGPVGDTPNVAMTIGSVSTLNAGQNATASISKSGTLTEPVFTLNFGIPQGAKGNTGNTGPQGPQGPKGDKGDKGDKGEQGGLIEIVGIVADASDLPDPEELDKLDAAYLVGTSPDYELYIQVGETPATAIWTNLGIINEGTIVMVDGNPQATWEANSRVAVYNDGLVSTIYAVSAGGSSAYHLPYGSGLVANGVVLRDASNQITVPESPSANGHATSKKYVDDKVSNANPMQYQGDIIVGGTGGAATRLAIGSAGQVLAVNSSANGLEYKTVDAVPSYTAADATKALCVNSLGTGIEWATVSGGGGGGDSLWQNAESNYATTINIMPVNSKHPKFTLNSNAFTNNLLMMPNMYDSSATYTLTTNNSGYGIKNNICTGNIFNWNQSQNKNNSNSLLSCLFLGEMPSDDNSSGYTNTIIRSLLMVGGGAANAYNSVWNLGTSKLNLTNSILMSRDGAANRSGLSTSYAWTITGCILLTNTNYYFSNTKGSSLETYSSVICPRGFKQSTTMENALVCGQYAKYDSTDIANGIKLVVGGNDGSTYFNAFTAGVNSTDGSFLTLGSTKLTEAKLTALLALLE